MSHRPWRLLVAALLSFSALFLAPAAAHADTYSVTTNPIPTIPGGANFTISGRVTPAPAAGSQVVFDGYLPNGSYQGGIATAKTNADGTFSASLSWGAGTQGLFQIRSAYCDTTGAWHRSDYQYFSRDNQISMSNPLAGTSYTRSTMTITGSASPARGGDNVVIDVTDSANTYHGGVGGATTNPDGSWSVTIDTSSYPTGTFQVRAAVCNGWWARTDYVTVTLN